MKGRLSRLIFLGLLTACGGDPHSLNSSPNAQPSTAVVAGALDSKSQILPGSKGDPTHILPGSKGDRTNILPGSKGDRSHIAALEVQLRLPEIGFQTAFVIQSEPTPAQWSVHLDSQVVKSRLIKVRTEGADAIIYFALENLEVESLNTHEIIFASSDKVVQAAALLPALKPEQTSISEPVTPQTTATWLVADEYQRKKGAKVQELNADELKILSGLPEITVLTEQIRDLYRSSKGKANLAKADQVLKELAKAVSQAEQKIDKQSQSPNQQSSRPSAVTNNSGNSASAPQTNNADNQSSTGETPSNNGNSGSSNLSSDDEKEKNPKANKDKEPKATDKDKKNYKRWWDWREWFDPD